MHVGWVLNAKERIGLRIGTQRFMLQKLRAPLRLPSRHSALQKLSLKINIFSVNISLTVFNKTLLIPIS